MKRLSLFLAACATGLLFSCTQQPDPGELSPLRTVSFRAVGETSTRTSLSGNTVLWSRGDKAAVFSGGGAAEFTASDIDGASCTFTGRAGGSGPVYALYPFNAEAFCTAGVISATLPSVQRPVRGGFDPRAALTVAGAAQMGDAMSFKNVGAIVRFSINAETAEDLVAVVLKSSGGTSLSGEVDISLSGGVPVATVTDGCDEVTLQGHFEAGEYCFVVLPGNHDGLTLTFKKPTLTGTMTSSFNGSLARSTNSDMGLLTPSLWAPAANYEPVTLEISFSTGAAFANPFETPDLTKISASTGNPSFPGARVEMVLPAVKGGYTCAAAGLKGLARLTSGLCIGTGTGDYFESPAIPGLCLNRITLLTGGVIAGACITSDEGKSIAGGDLIYSAAAKGETLSWTLYGSERGRAYRVTNAAAAFVTIQTITLEYGLQPLEAPVASVSPFDYGLSEAATGEDRYNALYRAHRAAVQYGLDVDYTGVGTVNLTIPADANPIPLTRTTDFKGAVFNVLNNAKKCYLFSMEKVFSRVVVSGTQIDNADYTSVPVLSSGMHILRIQDDMHWVDDREGYDHPADRADVVLVQDGIGSNGPVASYDTPATRINAAWCDADDALKTFCNVSLVRDVASTQIANLLSVRGINNLFISNVTIETPSDTGIYGDLAIDVRHCTNVTCEDVTFDGLYCEAHQTGYGFSFENVRNSTFRRIHSHNLWAAFGCNNLQDTTLEDSDVERFDIHCYGKNMTIRNSTLSGKGIPCSSIFGTILCENVIFSDCFAYSMRTEYNAFTPFDIVIRDCEFRPTTQVALVSLGKLDDDINPRPELAKKNWPNLDIDGLTVYLNAGATIFTLLHMSDTKQYSSPVGYISKVKVKNLEYVFKTNSTVRTYVSVWPVDVENKCDVSFNNCNLLYPGAAGPARVTVNLNGNVTTSAVDSNISFY